MILQVALRKVAFVALCAFSFVVVIKDTAVSRIFLFSWLFLVFWILVISNLALPQFVSWLLFRKRRVANVLYIFGQDNRGLSMLDLFSYKLIGVNVINWFEIDSGIKGGAKSIQIEDRAKIQNVILQSSVTHLILGNSVLGNCDFNGIREMCNELGVVLKVKIEVNSLFGESGTGFMYLDSYYVGEQNEKLENPVNRLVKRVLDLSIAVPIVILILPILTVTVWLLQKISSPGPILFRQNRCGINGHSFRIFKFRTLHLGSYDEAKQVTKDDVRITTYGKWLRKTSLDELPQFVNVLFGDMSVVGPRPHLYEHDLAWAKIYSKYRLRFLVKPGITGLAQVRGYRGEAKTTQDISKRISSDIEYINSWSLVGDLVIILRTIWQVLFPPKSAN